MTVETKAPPEMELFKGLVLFINGRRYLTDQKTATRLFELAQQLVEVELCSDGIHRPLPRSEQVPFLAKAEVLDCERKVLVNPFSMFLPRL